MSDLWRRLWPHLRALLVALHVFAVSAMAFPSPGGGMKKSAWADPTVQGEFTAWTARFNAWGIDVTHEELEAFLWEFATDYMAARKVVIGPFEPYYTHLGTYQTWRMFVAPHRYPAKLHVDVDRGAGWEPVYVERSREHRWKARVFDNDRMRSAVFRYSWAAYRREYRQMCEWIAEQAAVDFPAATAVRIRFYKYRTLSPRDVRAGKEVEGEFQQEVVADLAEFR